MEQKKKRGLGGKRCVRRNISLTTDNDAKLERLSIACGLPPATIVSITLDAGLNSPSFINWLQDQYNKRPEFRTTPIVENKRVILT